MTRFVSSKMSNLNQSINQQEQEDGLGPGYGETYDVPVVDDTVLE